MTFLRNELSRGMMLLVVLVALATAIYANSAHHVFHLDDHHSIQENPALRSLTRIPEYFVNPRTFSTLETNVDYRPVLQASYALNYAMAGYRMPVWHATSVAIHIWCAFFLYLFTQALLRVSGVDEKEALWTSLLVPLVFIVHPVNSGVVNYQAARSSELTAAFLLPAFYFDLIGRRRWALALLLLGLFTKVEAVAALAVFWALSALRHRRPLAAPKEWVPYLGAVIFYIAARQWAMTGINFAESAAAVGATRFGYLCTQITAWWAYVYQWFCPLNLVADNAAYPTYNHLWDLPVMLALAGWGFVCLALWQQAARRPHLPLLAFSALALISPTSSIVPLAEMMNEHRPYLPIALVSIIFVSGLVRLALSFADPQRRAAAVLVVVLWLSCLGLLTHQRNTVFLTSEAYWSDVLSKVPSGRAHNNYGLTLMKVGRMQEAKASFEASLARNPQYSTAHINLAIVNDKLGLAKEARQHYDLAVAYDRGAGDANMWRGAYLLQQGQFREAAADYELASKLSNDRYRVNAGLAHAYAGLGDVEKSSTCALEANAIDGQRFGIDIVAIASPYFTSQQQREKGLSFFAALEGKMPDTWWIYANQATLLKQLGRADEAAAKDAQASKLRGGP